VLDHQGAVVGAACPATHDSEPTRNPAAASKNSTRCMPAILEFNPSGRLLQGNQPPAIAPVGPRWHDPDPRRPLAALLERCAELLGVDLAAVRELAARVEPYLRADGTRIWSLMQLERQLRPEVYGRRQGGYLDRGRIRSADP
jgi:hypothetical protein